MDTSTASTILTEFLDSLGICNDPDNPIQWDMDMDSFHNDRLLADHTGYYRQGTLESPQRPTDIPAVFGNREY
jgi:hypothetical protein